MKSIILSNYIKDNSSVCNTQDLRYDEIIEIHDWNIGKRQQINESFYPLPVTERMILRNSPFCETTLFETMEYQQNMNEIRGSRIRETYTCLPVRKDPGTWPRNYKRLLKAQISSKYDVTSESGLWAFRGLFHDYHFHMAEKFLVKVLPQNRHFML